MEIRQIAAMAKNIDLGNILREEYPQIADIRREGATYLEIARILELPSRYHIKESTAEKAVGSALRGYHGDSRRKEYSGLMSKKELKDLSFKCRKRGGEMVRDNKLGVHSLTKDEIRKATYKGMKSLGHIPWSREEETFIIYLSLISEYQHLNGVHKGTPNYHKIADRLNNAYHYMVNIRTPLAVLRKAKRLSKLLTAFSQYQID
ncbi:hypothetical protein J4466_01810 [Candidatus Pacearchaeota archaeon]|nr:hypothetical protein [Candidatus Pacearchaeota archaeon]